MNLQITKISCMDFQGVPLHTRGTPEHPRVPRIGEVPHRAGVEYLVYGEGLDVDKVGGAGGLHRGPGLALRGLTARLCFGLIQVLQ